MKEALLMQGLRRHMCRDNPAPQPITSQIELSAAGSNRALIFPEYND